MPPIRLFKGEKQLGTFGALGGTMRLDAVPYPERVAFMYMRLADYIEDTRLPMLAAKRIAQEDMQRHFDTDTDPEGNPWVPLDPDYAKKKAKMGGDPNNILTLSGDLERGATSEAAWVATEEALFFKTSALPHYWDVHESGSGADMAGYAALVRERIRGKARLADDPGGARDSMDIGRGRATPARPFVGLTLEARNQIIELFDLWFDEGIKLTVHPKTGIVQQRVGGRFGQKMFPNFND